MYITLMIVLYKGKILVKLLTLYWLHVQIFTISMFNENKFVPIVPALNNWKDQHLNP